ncbi:MAG TPA: PepSY-associated TM helix domain-containing protein [Pseudoxanthomonas sp.]|nr:PepSY-associated TM helix domain-containing protein [Pseudoxanthomonas sp.]
MHRIPHRQANLSASVRRSFRAALKWLHLWLGLIAGLVFAAVALSGTVMTFQRELLLAAHPEWTQRTVPSLAAQGAVFSRIAAEWEPRGMRSVDLPSEKLPVWQGYFSDGVRRYFDPASGELLLTRSTDNDWILWLRDLHTHLLAGEAGEEALGIFGLISLFLLLSGLYLWWPRWRTLALSLRWHAQPPTRRWFSWHRSGGALLLPLLLLVTVTGVALIYHDAVRGALRGVFADGPEVVPPAPIARTQQDIDWSALLQIAESGLPNGELRRIALPKPDDALVSIRYRAADEWHPNGRSVIWLDPYRNRVVQRHDATTQGIGARIDEAMYPLHGGFVGGRAWQWAVALSGLVPVFLWLTGFLFWRARRRRTG